MNRSQHKQAVVALFLLGLISLSIVFVYASTIDLSAQLMKKRSIARADESLDLAVHALSDYVNTEATKSAEQIYSSLLAETNSDDLKVLGMGKKTSFFKKYIGEIKNCFGKSTTLILIHSNKD